MNDQRFDRRDFLNLVAVGAAVAAGTRAIEPAQELRTIPGHHWFGTLEHAPVLAGSCLRRDQSPPLRYKPEMSGLFMLSALVGGIALTLLASMLASRARVNDVLIERVAGVLAWLLVGYFYFRFWDMFAGTYTYEPGRSEGLRLLTTGVLSFNFWIGEILLGAFIPMVLLLNRKTRTDPFWRILALFLVAAGVVAYRWDTNLVGQLAVVSYWPGEAAIAYTSYRPSLIEWITGSGIVAYGLLAFSLSVKYLHVVDHALIEMEAEHAAEGIEEAVPDYS